MIPPLEANGLLPAGVHLASNWDEVVQRFGKTRHRKQLLAKLRKGLENLRDAGCPFVLLDGSFVSDKKEPEDVDGCWEYVSAMDLDILDVSFLLQSFKDRVALQADYGMDFFLAASVEAVSGLAFPEFFQQDGNGGSKGIVRLNLDTL